MRKLVKRMAVVGLLSSVCIGAVGCSTPAAHMQDLKERVIKSYTTSSPDHLYYVGSDRDSDYYFLASTEQRYKVPQTESLRDERMDLTTDRTKWQTVSPTTPTANTLLN